ncbi:MAG: DUF58 domain-containing protein [Planctomycetota bacterium]
MPDSKRFLHPETIGRIAKLDVRARHVVEGFLTGLHRSPYFGQSVEFRQHREYVPGDDLRHVDWKVWARQDRLYVKQFEEDTNLQCYLVVDVSASMQYGNGPLNKYEYACTMAACLAYLMLKQQDAVGCATFDGKVRNRVEPKTQRNHLQTILNVLEASPPAESTSLEFILRRAAEKVSRRSMMVLISDLLTNRDEIISGLQLCRQRGHDVLVFHVMDDDELDFPFSGTTRFDNLEGADFVTCNPRALRDGYLEALQAFLDDVRRGCASRNVDYELIRTSDSFAAVLAAYLSRRLAARNRTG